MKIETRAKAKNSNKRESYVAFLRGINNIGCKAIKMDELKSIFESSGLKNVKTISASGNVLFETTKAGLFSLTENIERNLKNKLGYNVSAVLRTRTAIEELVKSNPFKLIDLTPQTKLFLTFLSEKPMKKLKTPFESLEKDFKILRVTDSEIHSVVTLLPNKRPYRIIGFLEKEFGKKITNRNWNTILKIVNA
jgi:uncharacterized protein (DUF1697 family)